MSYLVNRPNQQLSRDEIIDFVKSGLDGLGFGYIAPSQINCSFDLMVRSRLLVFIKAFESIDSLDSRGAEDLKSVSSLLNGHPYVIATRNTEGESLRDDLMYLRQGLPVMTPSTFLKFLRRRLAIAKKFKRLTFAIDGEKLRLARLESKLTYDDLSSITGITREMLFRYEHGSTNVTPENIDKLEQSLKTRLRKIQEIELSSPAKKVSFFSIDFFQVGNPFKLATNVDKDVLSISFMSDRRTASKKAELFHELMGFLDNLDVSFYRDSSRSDDYKGIPVIDSDELFEIKSSEELLKLIREKKGKSNGRAD